MSLYYPIYAFWVAGLILQPALAVFLVARKLWRKYPIFTLYTVFNSIGNIIAFLLRETSLSFLLRDRPLLYFWFLQIFNGITTFIGFGIAYEIFRTIFSPHRALKRLATLVFGACAIILAGMGASLIISEAPFRSTDLMKSVLVVSEAARLLEVGLIGVLFLFSRAFGLHWRQATFGIALGLGIFATVELVATTIQSEFGPAAMNVLNLLRTGAFDVGLLTWIGYILAPEPSLNIGLPERSQLDEWNRAVMEFIQQ
jgi:prepilin signal peptidase PulO-like enzyme (type II secretory pathway)